MNSTYHDMVYYFVRVFKTDRTYTHQWNRFIQQNIIGFQQLIIIIIVVLFHILLIIFLLIKFRISGSTISTIFFLLVLLSLCFLDLIKSYLFGRHIISSYFISNIFVFTDHVDMDVMFDSVRNYIWTWVQSNDSLASYI